MTNFSFNHSDLFNSYLKNELSEVDTKKFNDRLNNDTEFKTEFKEYKNIFNLYLQDDIINTNTLFEEARATYKRKQLLKIIGLAVLIVASLSTVFIYYNNIVGNNRKKQSKNNITQSEVTKSTETKPHISTNPKKPQKRENQAFISSSKKVKTDTLTNKEVIYDSIISAKNTLSKNDSLLKVDSSELIKSFNAKALNDQDISTKKMNCDNLRLTINKDDICQTQSELGKIHLEEIEPVATISLDNEPAINFNDVFYDLEKGSHSLFVTFKNGCSKNYSIIINEVWCLDKNPSITYSQNEFWTLYLPTRGILEIRNRASLLQTKIDLNSGESIYSGRAKNGSLIKTGSYTYIIQLEDGQVKTGSLRVYP